MWKMLKHIAQTHRKRLLGTFSLVGLENLLMLVYPVFGGWAINAVIAGKVWQALLYALVVLLMWLVGAARRITDTRARLRGLIPKSPCRLCWNNGSGKSLIQR